MLEYIKKYKNCFWYFDILIVILVISIMFFSASFQSLPKLSSNKNLFLIPAFFFASIILGSFFFNKIFLKIKSVKKIKLEPNQLTYNLLLLILFIAIISIFISWGISIKDNYGLLKTSPIFGLRAITTSLHKLVPLESRIQFVLIPLVLLYPSLKRNVKAEWCIIFCFLVITFATLTKIGFLFAAIFLLVLFLIRLQTLKVLKKLKYIMVIFLILLIPILGLKLINYDINNAYHLNKEHDLKISTAEYKHSGVVAVSSCHGESGEQVIGTSEINSEQMSSSELIIRRLLIRSFDTPSRMIRLFICLREEGWHPNFRGHQLFRLVNLYIPYYRMAYEAYRPGEGNVISSAVTNVAADSFFNLDYLGVIISGCCLALIWSFLNLFIEYSFYWGMLIFIKIYLIEVIVQLSLLSALVTVAPIIGILIFDILKTNLKVSRENVL